MGNNRIRKIVKEAINSVTKVDKYGNPISRFGQGWGKDDALYNRQGYNEDGSKGPWFSRSVACATCVLLQDTDTGKWFVLASKRGQGAADYKGLWNLPCGYLDYNEDDVDGAIREVYEETGIKLNRSQMKDVGKSSSPYENMQNVVHFFAAIIRASKSNLPFSFENMEDNEVEGAQWLPIEKKDSLMWAFDHDELLDKILKKYSHFVNDEKMPEDETSKIRKAVEILENDGDTEYAIQILKSLL